MQLKIYIYIYIFWKNQRNDRPHGAKKVSALLEIHRHTSHQEERYDPSN